MSTGDPFKPLDDNDLRSLIRQASDVAEGDSQSHRLPIDPVKYGMTYREGYLYSEAPGGGLIGYPASNQPEIIQKKEGPMLRCVDGTAHFLTLWEQLALRAGFTTLAKLNEKYRLQNYQAG